MIQLQYQSHLLRTGNLTFQIDSNIPLVHKYLNSHYQQYPFLKNTDSFIDYHIAIKYTNWYRRLFKPQINFYFNNQAYFNPLPSNQAHALLEWGMNWVISTQAHQYLIVHAASLEKSGKGIIITAPSGSGKSTLCAYLVSQGWRLLSDEHALIDIETMQMHALARPINLKNNSIDLVKPFFDQKSFSTTISDTNKGIISLLKPPLASIKQAAKTAKPHLLVFLQYNESEFLFIEKLNKSIALTELIKNSFNFGLLNLDGFRCAKKLINRCDAIYIEYSNLKACEQALLHYMNKQRTYSEKTN